MGMHACIAIMSAMYRADVGMQINAVRHGYNGTTALELIKTSRCSTRRGTCDCATIDLFEDTPRTLILLLRVC